MHCAKCFFYETDVGDEVCNRCGRAYFPEANVYLGLLVLVAGGMAWTLRHLLTGDADPFVRPASDLGTWVTWPVSIVDCPAYGFVIGAWLGMLGAAPVLTGIMYGKRGGWLLAILMAALGPSLPMAAAAALGVWIAAGWTTRLGSKLSSALLGLAPAAAWWFGATALPAFFRAEGPAASGAAGLAVETGRALPAALHSLAYVAPIVASAVAVAAAGAVVAIGRADRWHVRWPGVLLAALVAGPAAGLLAAVGIDRIYFGMYLGEGPVVCVEGAPSGVVRLQQFLARHPSSPLAAEVRARLAEQLERAEAAAPSPPAPSSAAPPVRSSKDVWQELVKKDPASPWAADARLHLGDAAAAQGFFEQADELYRAAGAQKPPLAPPANDPVTKFTFWDLFSVGAELQARDDAAHLEAVHQEALMHQAILRDNRRSKQEDSRALALYFAALGLRGTNRYRDALLNVRQADPKGPIADNVAFDLATFEANAAKRVEELRGVATAWPGTDGAMLARLRAARDLIDMAASDPGSMREAEAHLLAAQRDLAARKARNPADPYVAALADRVEKELVYVQAQLRAPKTER
jgi:hypothetical protein